MAAAYTADQPVLEGWLQWVWRAWHRLTHDRPWISGGLGGSFPSRIPWTVVAAWCEHHGYGADEMRFLDRCLSAMDETYLAWHAEQTKAPAGK